MRTAALAVVVGLGLAVTGCHEDAWRIDALEAAGRGPGPKGDPGAPGRDGDAGAPGKDGQSSFTAGSRLKPRVRTGSDGSKEMIGWYDEQLGAPCRFMNTADGERCVPGVPGAGAGASGTIAFTSDTCTGSPVFVPDPEGCGLPAYVYSNFQIGVPAECLTTVVFAIGAPLGKEGKLYKGTPCTEANGLSGFQQYEMTEIAPSALVSASTDP